MLTSPLNKLGLAIFITKNACQHRCRQYHRTSSSEIPLTHSYSYTIGLGLTRGASSCAPATHSMTSSLHVTNDVITYFYLSRHIYFYHTSSPSAESAYIIPIFTILRRHFKQYKKTTQDSFHSFSSRTATTTLLFNSWTATTTLLRNGKQQRRRIKEP